MNLSVLKRQLEHSLEVSIIFMDDWLLAIPEKSIKYSRLLGDSQIVINGTLLHMES